MNNSDTKQAKQLNETAVSKSVFKYEIEKLDSGFLVNKMDIMLNEGYEKCGHNIKSRVGISNIDTLETQMNKVIIKLSVEVLL